MPPWFRSEANADRTFSKPKELPSIEKYRKDGKTTRSSNSGHPRNYFFYGRTK
jgi:hypothetical protein